MITTAVYDGRTSTFTTRVTVINTVTGGQTGTPVTLAGNPDGPPLLTADGGRAVVTTIASDSSRGRIRVVVINTATGAQVGSTVTFAGSSPGTLLSVDGSRTLITAGTRAVVVNTATVHSPPSPSPAPYGAHCSAPTAPGP